jgi:hypothetical protein
MPQISRQRHERRRTSNRAPLPVQIDDQLIAHIGPLMIAVDGGNRARLELDKVQAERWHFRAAKCRRREGCQTLAEAKRAQDESTPHTSNASNAVG